MKIDGYTPLPESVLSKQDGPGDRSAMRDPATGAPSIQDEARLSVDSERIGLLQSKIAQLPDVRQDRVAALQSALQQGRYQISNDQIAASMLNEFLG
jgi:flagellar biosynthesis anti-sigma factor FlgM